MSTCHVPVRKACTAVNCEKQMFTNSICSSHKWHDTKWKLQWTAVTIVTVHMWSFPRIHTSLSFFCFSCGWWALSLRIKSFKPNIALKKFSPQSQGRFIYIAQYQKSQGSWQSALYTKMFLLYPPFGQGKTQSLSVLVISFLVQSHTQHHCGKCFDDIKHVTVIMQKYQMTKWVLKKTHLSNSSPNFTNHILTLIHLGNEQKNTLA